MKFLPQPTRRYVRKRCREQTTYGLERWRAPRANQRKVVIFAQGRSGSALLESLLASTGHFPLNGEVLNTVSCEIRYPRRYLDGLTRWSRFLAKGNFLFHVKIYQLTQDRSAPIDVRAFLSDLSADGWQIIYLKRENVVRQALSNVFAEQSGIYHRFGKSESSGAITIDANALIRKIEQRIQYGREEAEVLKGLDYHTVVYETDLAPADQHQPAIDAILGYLGLPAAPVHTSHRKVVARDMSERVEN